jgi:selenocysteine lyase/cysteine desulfurase
MAIAAAGGSAILVTGAIIAYRRKREPGYLETAAAATAKSTKSTLPDVNKTYYLDYNGTTPVYPQVFHSMVPYLKEHFGNPSSGHVYGKEPRRAIDEARHKVLHSLLGVTHAHQQQLDSLWFCGCGTEADNLAIHLALQAAKTEKPHVVTSNVEHPAIELYLKALENEQRIDVTYVPVDKEGRVSATDMIAALTEKTIFDVNACQKRVGSAATRPRSVESLSSTRHFVPHGCGASSRQSVGTAKCLGQS